MVELVFLEDEIALPKVQVQGQPGDKPVFSPGSVKAGAWLGPNSEGFGSEARRKKVLSHQPPSSRLSPEVPAYGWGTEAAKTPL